MTDLKQTIAKNITTLRQGSKMTQIELAEKLNYSDKAISKWERGESIPDVIVLKSIADLFGVTLDYLLQETHQEQPEAVQEISGRKHRNHTVVTTLSILLVWLICTLCFVSIDIASPQISAKWLSFLYGVPISMIVWLVFNSIWFNKRRNYLIISLLMWTVLISIVLTVLTFDYFAWQLLLLGIPGQIIIYVWSRFQRKVNV
ncbi:MAG: helix-turn-helix transcriptional regulator [Oscillospiraceae bacterium]|nr:helix-turn-helix transcriptional regulator [Oscillospiraceae bacterium]